MSSRSYASWFFASAAAMSVYRTSMRTSSASVGSVSRSLSRSVARRSYVSFFAFFARSTSWTVFLTLTVFVFFFTFTFCRTVMTLFTIGLIDAESVR